MTKLICNNIINIFVFLTINNFIDSIRFDNQRLSISKIFDIKDFR